MNTNIDSHSIALNKVPFFNDNTEITKELINRTANLSDNDIIEISKSAAFDKSANSKAAKVQKALYPAIIGTLIASNVIAKKGPASSKLAAAGVGVLSYAALNASVNGAVKLAEKTAQKTGKDKESARDIAYLGSIASFALLYKGAVKALPRVSNYLIKKLPKSFVKNTKTNLVKFDKTVENSKITKTLSKYIAAPAKALVAKFPKASEFLYRNLGIIGIAVYVAGSALLTNKIINDTNRTYSDTKSTLLSQREEAKKLQNQ